MQGGGQKITLQPLYLRLGLSNKPQRLNCGLIVRADFLQLNVLKGKKKGCGLRSAAKPNDV